MERDASLDEFLDSDGESGDDGTETSPDRASESSEKAEAGRTGSASEDAENTVPPAASTGGWTAGGTACAECGTVVERRWRDGAGLVCSDCKTW